MITLKFDHKFKYISLIHLNVYNVIVGVCFNIIWEFIIWEKNINPCLFNCKRKKRSCIALVTIINYSRNLSC